MTLVSLGKMLYYIICFSSPRGIPASKEVDIDKTFGALCLPRVVHVCIIPRELHGPNDIGTNVRRIETLL